MLHGQKVVSCIHIYCSHSFPNGRRQRHIVHFYRNKAFDTSPAESVHVRSWYTSLRQKTYIIIVLLHLANYFHVVTNIHGL